MAVWRKGSPVSFCLSRYAPPLCRPVRHAGNANQRLFSSGFIIQGDVRATMLVELRMLYCTAQPVYLPRIDDKGLMGLRSEFIGGWALFHPVAALVGGLIWTR
ncbi:hypothetical protein AMECASPLE_029763 [Ameca splendens]|uniref:Uncharacterized protein n=1 Tax=Ameca splendens TaxID=208324 RepID=A0ABV1AC70_9TELE